MLSAAATCTAQTTQRGADVAFASTGQAVNDDWLIWGDGHVGTFLHLDNPGQVTVTLNASGRVADAVWPLMDLHVANQKASWEVDTSDYEDYSATFDLPAGTHSLRTEFLNDLNGGAGNDRNLWLRSLSISGPGTGAAFRNSTSAAVINDAADTYIENFRQGAARVSLTNRQGTPLAVGTPVHVKLRRHAFHFGTAVAGRRLDNGNLLFDNPTPGSDEFKYQQALATHFNLVTPEQAGGWKWNEDVRGAPTMGYVDLMTDFAQSHNMDVRMTSLLYAKGLRPNWVVDLEDRALAGDTAARDELRAAITDRVQYYVSDRVAGQYQLNAINESYHSPFYSDLYGTDGVAGIYNETIDAVRQSGSEATVSFNEYGVLGAFADYGEFDRAHIQEIVDAGITPENQQRLRIDIQNYTNANKHGVQYIHQGLQNLSWFEYPITLSEFGVSTGDQGAPQMLLDNMRLVFGTDGTDGFVMWGFWEPRMWDVNTGAALFDADWNLTEAGRVYQQLLGIEDWELEGVPVWTTDVVLLADENGQIDFRGFYGDYDVTVDDTVVDLALVEGTENYALEVPEPNTLFLAALGGAILLLLGRSRRATSHTT